METNDTIQLKHQKLIRRYKRLIEQAYNVRQTDAALADFFEYKAVKLLSKINRLNYITREAHVTAAI
ncbi:Lacal_2735 family protein [Mangrovimonas aestuarii]|uniref:Lacal_2735 family protein n=1 Tax=Mangrovimonas aestuarii TaxID=3018443 RepID=UPI0023783A85|nr:Lacal_2735 family protein [Mangrovimonas aestuarii]